MKKPDGRAFGLVPLLNGFGCGREIDPNPFLLEVRYRFRGERDHAVLARAQDEPVGPLFEYVLGLLERDGMRATEHHLRQLFLSLRDLP